MIIKGDVLHFSSSLIEEKSSFQDGQVNHALTAAMRMVMKEYLVTQLEHLQWQKLWFYIQPTMPMVEEVSLVVDLRFCVKEVHTTPWYFSELETLIFDLLPLVKELNC